jgi:hypothetical protein
MTEEQLTTSFNAVRERNLRGLREEVIGDAAAVAAIDAELREIAGDPPAEPPSAPALAEPPRGEINAEARRLAEVALAIVEAGRRARGEIDDRPVPLTGAARQIVEASDKARDGVPVDDPKGLAAQIIAAGKKARGEAA